MQVLWTGHGLAQLPERPIYVLEVWAQVWGTETEYISRTSKKVTVSEEHHSQQALLLAFGVSSHQSSRLSQIETTPCTVSLLHVVITFSML